MKDHDETAARSAGGVQDAHPGARQRHGLAGWCLLMMLMTALCLGRPAAAAEIPVMRAYAQATADEASTTPATIDSEHFTPLAPDHYIHLSVDSPGIWLRLDPPADGWPQEQLMLSLPGLANARLQLWAMDGAGPARAIDGEWQGHGRLALALPSLPPDTRLLLRVARDRMLLPPLQARVQTLSDFLHSDAYWLSFASACLAALVVTALMAALFALQLRDAAYACYTGYALAYALLQAVQTGYAQQVLHLDHLGIALLPIGRVATAASVCFAALFLDRFADLRVYVPRLRSLLMVPAGLITVLLALSLAPLPMLPALQTLSSILINPLLLAGALLMPVLATLAWRRGSRYAGYFLLGWLPLMVITGLGSAQADGAFPNWAWLDNASLAAGALEAMLLSLGLGERALAVRHERDRALKLADCDALTGLLNRRAWTRQLTALLSTPPGRTPVCAVLFLDLDHFKRLNDRLGHEAGDSALVAVADVLRRELRPQDAIGRYGGEEFVAALPGCGATAALRVAERMRDSVRGLGLMTGAEGPPLTASIGIAVATAQGNVAQLLARADQAMYRAKAEGRDRVMLAATPEPGISVRAA